MSERKIQEMAKDEEATDGEPEEAADENQEPTAPEEVTRGVAKARGRLFATAKEAEKYLVAEEKRYLKIGRRTLTGWEARVCTAGSADFQEDQQDRTAGGAGGARAAGH